MERSQRLAEGNIPRLLLSFAAPAIVGLVAQALEGRSNQSGKEQEEVGQPVTLHV